MGSGASKRKVSPKSNEKTTEDGATEQKFLKLTDAEKKGIRTVWHRAKGKDVAMELIVEVITLKPNFAIFFDTHFTTPNELRNCPRIQGHAAKIVGFIDKIVTGLDEITVDEIRRMLFNVGIIHFNKSVNFDAASYLMFKKILMEKICEDVEETTKNAWFKLLQLMVREMKNGFFSEVLKQGKPTDD